MVGRGKVLRRLTFGHRSAEAAARALEPGWLDRAEPGTWNAPLLRRLQAFASGVSDDFRDVQLEPSRPSEFRRRVTRRCRRIPYGQTLTYGELAAAAGSPGAARAVGNCMAANRFPLIVPCHRVVAADGHIGHFSAPGGTGMKRRLLAMEARCL